MTKLWSYEVGEKTGKLQQRRDVIMSRRYNVATFQRRDVAESCRNAASRRRDVAKRRRDIRGGFWMDF